MARICLLFFILFALLSCSNAPAVYPSVSPDAVHNPFYSSGRGAKPLCGVECFLKVEERLLAQGDVELSFSFVNDNGDSVVWVEGSLCLPSVTADTLSVALPKVSISLQ